MLKDSNDLKDCSAEKTPREGGANSLERFEQLVSEFERLPKPEKRRFKTFLEIAKFPHDELACSNVLAFFLDPKEEHKLGGVVMKSLVEAVCPRLASADFVSVDVEREDRTDSNKSIDLVIVGDALLVGIENKIYAGLYNPFAEYRKRLEDIVNE